MSATTAAELELAELYARLEALEAAQSKPVEQKNKLTIIAWGGDLDRIWPTLILSTTAAASGMEVTVFFTFWGLFALVKDGVRVTGDNWMQKGFSIMNPGNPAKAKLSKLNFAGAGAGMMKKLAKDYGTPQPAELLETARDLGVRLIPCQMTMDLMGLTADDLVEGLEEPIGAATALLEMQEASISLFI